MATIKKENAIKAWEEGCNDVKQVLENLFPDIEFKPKSKYQNQIGKKFNIIGTLTEIEEDDNSYPYQLTFEGLFDNNGEEETFVVNADSMKTIIALNK